MEEIGDAEGEAEEDAEYTGPVQEVWSVKIRWSFDGRSVVLCYAKVEEVLCFWAAGRALLRLY